MSCSELLSPGVSLLDILASTDTNGGLLDQCNKPLTEAQLEDLLHVLQEQAQQQQQQQQQQLQQLSQELPTPKQQMAPVGAHGPLASNNLPACAVQQHLSDAEYAIDAEICQLLALKQQARQKQRRHSQNMALHQLAARLQASGPTSNLLHDLHNALHMQDVASQMALLQEQSATASEQPWRATAAYSQDSMLSSAAPAATAAAVSRPGTSSRSSIDIGSYYQQNVTASSFAAGAAGPGGRLQQCSMALAAAAEALSMPFGSALGAEHSPFLSAGQAPVDLGIDMTAVMSGLNLQDTDLLLTPQQSYGSCVLPSAALSSFGGGLSPAQSMLHGTCSSSSTLLMPAAASSFDFAPAGVSRSPASAQAYFTRHNSDVLHRASGVLDHAVLDATNVAARGLYSPDGPLQADERARARRHSLQLPGSSAQYAAGAGAMFSSLGAVAWVQDSQPGNTEQQDAVLGPACRPFGSGAPPAQVGLLPVQAGSKNRRHSVHLAGVGCMPAPHSNMPAPHSSGLPAQWRAGAAASGAQEAFAGHAGPQGMQVSTGSSRSCRASLDVPAAATAVHAGAAAASAVFKASTRQPGGVSRQSLEVTPNGAARSGRQSLDIMASGTARRSVDLPAKFAAPKWADASWHPKAAAAATSGAGSSSQPTKGTGVFMPRMAA